MKVLITGSHGFMGKHLINRFKQLSIDYFSYDLENTDADLFHFVKSCDFIIHLAGVMRPLNNEEFYNSNLNLTKKLLDIVKDANRNVPILFASSTQAVLDNDYGKTKKMCENLVFDSGLPCYVFRFTNAFGKWGKPNYNSVASTFFYNIANDLDIYIRDPNFVIHFIYIDDIVDTILKCINGDIMPTKNILSVSPVYDCTIGHLAELIKYFKESIVSNTRLPIISNDFELKLFITFCDYFSDSGKSFNFLYDSNGTYEEIFRSQKYGAISIFKIYSKTAHADFSLNRAVLQAIKGTCLVEFCSEKGNCVKQEMRCSLKKTFSIVAKNGYTIQNTGDEILIAIMWTLKGIEGDVSFR